MWVACLSAISAVVFRSNGMMVAVTYDRHARPSLFGLDRVGQMTQNHAEYEKAVRQFDGLVPRDGNRGGLTA